MKQARKSSEDAQAGYAQFEEEKSLGWVTFGSQKVQKIHFGSKKFFLVKKVFWVKKGFWVKKVFWAKNVF